MFFRYPIEAIADNWLHDCLAEMIESLLTSIGTGTTPEVWPDIIPESRREDLKGKHGLRDRWNTFVVKVVDLPPKEAQAFLREFEKQNQIASLLSGTSSCKRLTDFPPKVQGPVKDLFTFAYELVRDGEIREKAYQIIDNKRPQKMCPFCGYEPMSAVTLPKDALDHYLCKELYPFAAANLRNLAPIGHKCNSSYKLGKDVLLTDEGVPRKALDPYSCHPVTLKGVLLDFEPETRQATWSVQFDRDAEEVQTWLDIFLIRDRFEKDILSEYIEWFRLFSSYANEVINQYGITDARQLLVMFTAAQIGEDYSGRGFVRKPFFERMIELFDSESRVEKFIQDVVS